MSSVADEIVVDKWWHDDGKNEDKQKKEVFKS